MKRPHSTAPSPDLVQQWEAEASQQDCCTAAEYIASAAVEWAIEGYYMWIKENGPECFDDSFLVIRRRKAQDLKKQALDALYAIAVGADDMRELCQDIDTIRLALEQLDD